MILKAMFIYLMKVKGDLYQDNQQVGKDLWQDNQRERNLYQDNQEVAGDLCQNNQEVKANLFQGLPKKFKAIYISLIKK